MHRFCGKEFSKLARILLYVLLRDKKVILWPRLVQVDQKYYGKKGLSIVVEANYHGEFWKQILKRP